MVGDVLSQTEVQGLLAAMVAREKSGAASLVAAGDPPGQLKTDERATPYDFKRPERVRKDQMRALQMLHEGFGRSFGTTLSAMLRSMVDVKLTSVDQLSYNEFVFGLESPSCINVIKAEPLSGSLVLDINPAILYPMIDRLLGGGRDPGPMARRPLTEIETRLVNRITAAFLDHLKHAWKHVVELLLSVERVESNAQLVQVVSPNEPVILLSFEVTMGDTRGMMNLCIPFAALERVGSHLMADSWSAQGQQAATPQTTEQMIHSLRDATVELVVELAHARINTADLLGLRVGDIITTEKAAGEPLRVEVEGVAKFRARPGALKGRKAILIETGSSGKSPAEKGSV